MRVEWNAFDLMTPEGVKVEVKSSGYIQTWNQRCLTAPRFGIAPTNGWDSGTNSYSAVRMRQSDVYVFCVFANTDMKTLNPLDTRQWRFYILPTAVLDAQAGARKSIGLRPLIRLGAEECPYSMLRKRIAEICRP